MPTRARIVQLLAGAGLVGLVIVTWQAYLAPNNVVAMLATAFLCSW